MVEARGEVMPITDKGVGPSAEPPPPSLLDAWLFHVEVGTRAASGKTTLAQAIGADFIIDGDDLRKLDNPGYDEAGRRQNVDRAQAIAAYLSNQGFVVAVALIAPYRDQREAFKARHDVVEIYLHTTETRGREHYFADDYQPPQEDYLDIDTGCSIAEAVRAIHRAIPALPRRP